MMPVEAVTGADGSLPLSKHHTHGSASFDLESDAGMTTYRNYCNLQLASFEHCV
jgi:hypothetical protein